MYVQIVYNRKLRRALDWHSEQILFFRRQLYTQLSLNLCSHQQKLKSRFLYQYHLLFYVFFINLFLFFQIWLGEWVKNGYQVWTFSLDPQVTYKNGTVTDKCILNLDILNTDISNNMDMSVICKSQPIF